MLPRLWPSPAAILQFSQTLRGLLVLSGLDCPASLPRGLAPAVRSKTSRHSFSHALPFLTLAVKKREESISHTERYKVSLQNEIPHFIIDPSAFLPRRR